MKVPPSEMAKVAIGIPIAIALVQMLAVPSDGARAVHVHSETTLRNDVACISLRNTLSRAQVPTSPTGTQLPP